MAAVRIARFHGPEGVTRVVAIKQLHAQFAQNPEFSTMFLDEAHVASRIRHKNVVPVLDVVSADGQLLLVMEYVPGASLARLMQLAVARGELVPPPIVAAVLVNVLDGLHAAHEARGDADEELGVVHRDVSPQNIMVGTDGVARVLDFGIAKAVGRAQTTREGQLKGKMAYMAPEQLSGQGVDRRTDVYAAAAVLWEALVGRPVFLGDNDVEVFGKVLAGATSAPSHFLPSVSPALDSIAMRGLSLEPGLRFATAQEMAQALRASAELASPSEVSAWVNTVASDDLATRAARVAAVMALSDEPDDSFGGGISPLDLDAPIFAGVDGARVDLAGVDLAGVAPELAPTQLMVSRAAIAAAAAHESRARAKKKRGWEVALAVLIGIGAVFAIVFRPKRATHEADHVPPATAASVPSTVGPAAAVSSGVESAPPAGPPQVAADAAPSSAEPARPVDASAPRAPGPRGMPAVKPKVKPKAKDDCDPPFYFDSAGTKRYKRECN